MKTVGMPRVSCGVLEVGEALLVGLQLQWEFKLVMLVGLQLRVENEVKMV